MRPWSALAVDFFSGMLLWDLADGDALMLPWLLPLTRKLLIYLLPLAWSSRVEH
jgi:hypothetical protein